MLSRRFLSLLSAVILAGCASYPEPYPPPPQRWGPQVVKPPVVRSFIRMNDPHAEQYIVGGISPTVEAGTWRWAFERPELEFHLEEAEGWKFVMEFALPAATFKDTGPVTLAVRVNDAPLGKMRCDRPGTHRLEMPAPAAVVRAGKNRVVVEPDRVWPSGDGRVLGFILISAGFER